MYPPGEVVPGSWYPGSVGLHRLPGCQGVGVGGRVDSGLCLHTRFLVAAAAELTFHARRLWVPC